MCIKQCKKANWHVLQKILYLTTIRPRLEYASPVWDPFHGAEIESVQMFALSQLAPIKRAWHQ